jgi:hypothetical protein
MQSFQKQIGILCALTLAMLPAAASWAKAADDEDRSGSIKWSAEIGFEHTDNLFHLSQSQEAALEEMEEENVESHRFEDMESMSDTILSPEFGFRYKTDSPMGGKFSIGSRVAYNFHMDNKERNYPEAKITLEQSVGKKGVLSLENEILFDFFKKNYLSAVDDENGNGNIPRDERTYSAASYDEYESILSYEHEVLKNKGQFLSEVDIRPFIGYGSRTYNSIFENRDRNIAMGGVGLVFEFMSRLDLDVIYTYESVSGANGNELVLFDETAADTDVNDDGDIESNAALVTRIDRSSDRYTIEISPSLKFSKDIRLFAEYKKRTTDYQSDNALDIDHYGKTAYREKIGFGIQYDFMKSWSAEVEYGKTDEDDEDDDYTENVFSVSVKCGF